MAHKKNVNQLTTITPFSKTIALLLFALLPFMGCYVGIKYQEKYDLLVQNVVASDITQLYPNKLVITRIVNNLNPAPFTRIITDEKKVKEIYKDLYALPEVSKGEFSCPRDTNRQYSFDFYYKSELVIRTVFHTTGCSYIQIPDSMNRSIENINGEELLNNIRQTLGVSATDF